MGSGRSEADEAIVPEFAVEAVGRTLSDIQDLESYMRQFISLAHPDVLAELSPLNRAHVFLILAKCTSILFSGANAMFFF